MARYTYEDFRKNAQSSGLLNEFSQADLQRAQSDPDFGMSILNYKKRYHNATSDADRAAANRGAEELRSSWGGYTGGADGGSFVKDVMSPIDFQYGNAPTYSGSAYDDDIADLWNAQKNFGDFTYDDAPTYTSRWDPTIQEMIQGILDRPDFSYDPETDLLYQQYRKQYNREGDRATADALGAAAAASGGLPSSYATTAAAQAGNYYASQLTDKIPELYQLAYNKYLNDYDMQLSDLGVVQGQEQTDYDRYLNALSQYNTDREFAYNDYLNDYNMANQNLQTALGLQNNDFNQYLAALDQFNTDRNFAYGQFSDELTSQANDRANALEEALMQAEMGDYRGLASLGWDTSNNPLVQQQNADAQALAQAQIDAILAAGGTPSADLIAQSGYSQEYVNALRNAYLRELNSRIGSSGGGGSRSSGGSGSSGSGGGVSVGATGGTGTVNTGTTLSPYAQILQDNILQGSVNTLDMLNRAAANQESMSSQATALQRQINSIPGLTQENKVSMIEDAYNNGRISRTDVNALLNAMGY